MNKVIIGSAMGLMVFSLQVWGQAYNGCAAHDHNCFHSSTPFDPSLKPLTTGSGDLTITSRWQGDADINQHTALPDQNALGQTINGPFVGSNPNGQPVTAAPLGTDANVVYHGQQTVQFANATARANLTSDQQPLGAGTRTEETIISGNVPSGLYDFSLHSYNERTVPDTANVSTTVTAGEDGFFLDAGTREGARLQAGHLLIDEDFGTTTQIGFGDSLGPDAVAPTTSFNYQYRGFDEHANGVYVIPDGVWNLHGVDPQQLYQFGSADMREGFILNQGYQFEVNPFNMNTINIPGYGDWLFDASSGVFINLGHEYEDLGEMGGGVRTRLNYVSTDPFQFNTLTTALFARIDLMREYGLTALGQDQRGHANGYSQDQYHLARQIIGCFDCSQDRLHEINQAIQSGRNGYGLSLQQRMDFHTAVTRGYSTRSLYRDYKESYRRNYGMEVVGQAITVALQANGIPLSVQLGYQDDMTFGDPNRIATPPPCSRPPCNGRSQNRLALDVNDMVRVDSTNNTIQVNGGAVQHASIYDVAGDGNEGATEYLEYVEGGRVIGLGVTQYGVTVSVTTGPQGTSYGVSGGIPQTPVSVGVSCQGGECGGTVGVTANVSGGVTVGASVNTEGDLSGRVGYQVTHQDGETGQVYYDSNTGLGAAVTTTTAQENDDGSTSYIIIGIDSETGLILAGYRSPAAEEAANNDGCVDNDCSNDANGYDETNALSDAQGTNDGGTAAGEINAITCAPCNIATGHKYQPETDFAYRTLQLERHYNSGHLVDRGLGVGWSSNLLKTLRYDEQKAVLSVVQGDGRQLHFKNTDGQWVGQGNTQVQMSEVDEGYHVHYPDGQIEQYSKARHLVSITDRYQQRTTYTYDDQQRLQRITGPYGHHLRFRHDRDGRIAAVMLPDESVYQYHYDDIGNLRGVVYPDERERRYHYENSDYPHHLTGISDEKGQRWSQVVYDPTGKVASSGLVPTDHETAQQASAFVYKAGEGLHEDTEVTDANGQRTLWRFKTQHGRKLPVEIRYADGTSEQHVYDEHNNRILTTNAAGQKTRWVYNEHQQLIATIEAAGSGEERYTYYDYADVHSDEVVRIEQPSVAVNQHKETVITTETTHSKTIRTVQVKGFTPGGTPVSRALAWHYNAKGQLILLDGARTDVDDHTRLTYYDCQTGGRCGQIKTVTNALGHVMTFTAYDALGRVLQVKDANGGRTEYVYNARGRVISETMTPQGKKGKHDETGRTTHYEYDAANQLITVRYADGVQLQLAYDASHALRTVTDNLGHVLTYSYDANGNRTGQSLSNADGDIEHESQTAYDLHDRVRAVERGTARHTVLRDAVGRLQQATDAKQQRTVAYEYDALGRVTQVLNALNHRTQYDYNVADQLTQVITANGAETRYDYDDLGNRIKEVSPDRGIIRYRYDAAGNLIERIDGVNHSLHYRYDALNRLASVTDAKKTIKQRYRYDTGSKGCRIGRLCRLTDNSGQTRYQYDGWGNVAQQEQRIKGQRFATSYDYDQGNRVQAITYPSGATVTYQRDVLGRISGIEVNGKAIITNRTYRADGQFKEQRWGNGQEEQRHYDTQGRLIQQTLPTLNDIHYAYDANGNPIRIAGQGYHYDALNRLVTDESGEYHYDANHNRLLDDQQPLHYEPRSNRLHSLNDTKIEHDANGNQLNDEQGRQYHYNPLGQLVKLTKGDQTLASYRYNANYQRVQKTIGKATTYYHYNQQGQLLQETSKQQSISYVWLDNQPIAQIEHSQGAEKITYLISDHLGTPRLGLNDQRTITWSWHSDGFGQTKADNDPDNDGHPTIINLRFAGQYYDQESGLHYNWHRYYHPKTGRYITSDPIGLAGGPNTFGYVGGNPLNYIDFNGLSKAPAPPRSSRAGNGQLRSISGEFAQANVRDLVREIQRYDSNFRYSVLSEGSARYTSRDVQHLQSVLNSHRSGGQCRAGPITTYYPPNNGFIGSVTNTTLQSGQIINRYGGGNYSRFFSPVGTPAQMRALPQETASLPLRTFEVIRPFTVESGYIAPAFNQIGLGVQYRSNVQLGQLLREGYLREIL